MVVWVSRFMVRGLGRSVPASEAGGENRLVCMVLARSFPLALSGLGTGCGAIKGNPANRGGLVLEVGNEAETDFIVGDLRESEAILLDCVVFVCVGFGVQLGNDAHSFCGGHRGRHM